MGAFDVPYVADSRVPISSRHPGTVHTTDPRELLLLPVEDVHQGAVYVNQAHSFIAAEAKGKQCLPRCFYPR